MEKLKILHYTFGLPPKATGGLPLYVRDLSNAQKTMGHEVNILLPKQRLQGKDKIYKKDGNYYLNNSLPVSSVFGMKSPDDFMKSYNQEVIEEFLEMLHPDIIHIHSLMGLPKEFLEIAKLKNIKLIYTTHDYYGLCLKCSFVDTNGKVCENNNPVKCAKCNSINGLSTKMCYLVGTTLYRNIKKNAIISNLKSRYRDKNVNQGMNQNLDDYVIHSKQTGTYKKLQNYYKDMFNLIDNFHFNSNLTKEVYQSYLPNIKGKVIPITLAHIDNLKYKKRTLHNPITFGYIGRKEPYKGIDLLINSLKKLDENNYDFRCLLYGDNFENYDNLLNGKIKNMGTYASNELEKIFDLMDILIVPSICKETFGFVVPESLACGLPVLVSENVGSKDLVCSLKIECVFNEENLHKILYQIINNKNILEKYISSIENKVMIPNSGTHINQIIDLYLTRRSYREEFN